MRRAILTAGAAFMLGALLGPGGAVASSGAGGTTLVLQANFKQGALVDAGESGFGAGDQQVVAGTLTRDGNVVGRFGFICEFLTGGGKAQEQCAGTGRLANGTITVSGFSRMDQNDHTWAVVGGTGRFSDATGQALIHDVNDHTSDVTIQLG